LCHISTAKEIDYIRKNPNSLKLRETGKLFVEVTPHHLFLTNKDENNFVNMKPSLKTKEDQKSLWKAINDGIVDTIATDHAPHTKGEKLSQNSPFGVPGVETMLPLLFDAYNKKKISLKKIIDLICKNTVKIFGIKNKGEIIVGNDADLTILDLNLFKKVDENKLHTKCSWSPFANWELKGWPIMTIVNGNIVFDRGKIFDNVKGKEIIFKMKNKPNLSIQIGNINWENPVTTASGTYGVDWPVSKNLDEKKLGALTCKSITLESREGHKAPTMIKTASGMLNAVGLKNPGVNDFIKSELPKILKFNIPLIVSIAGKDNSEYFQLAKILDKEKEIDYLELNFSCPNVHTGMTIGTDPYQIKLTTQKIKEITNKPIIVKLSPNVTDIKACAKGAEDGGADAISLINTLMGMAINLEKRKPILTNNTGGLSGSAIKPIALRMVWDVYNTVKIPIIAMGGISSARDALEFIVAGATAVSIGTANYTNSKVTEEIIEGIEKYLYDNQINDINKLRGTLELNGG
jgi:dihydroorotate dehydrogenase (NAD+) catalytic subunit